MRRNEIPAPLPFIFNLTSDFCGDRCRAITLRFPPEAEFAQSHDAQPLMINCEQLWREQRALSLSFFLSPDWTQTLLSPGARQRLCVSRHFKCISTSCKNRDALVIPADWGLGRENPEVELANLTTFLTRVPLCRFSLTGQRKMSKVIIITVTITITITLATVQFEPFVLRAFN